MCEHAGCDGVCSGRSKLDRAAGKLVLELVCDLCGRSWPVPGGPDYWPDPRPLDLDKIPPR